MAAHSRGLTFILSLLLCLSTFSSISALKASDELCAPRTRELHTDELVGHLNELAKREDDGDYTCSKSKPCKNKACCGADGWCGYAPNYCGTGCTSNCDAKAECGEYAKTPGKECPINVCCSKNGFCGVTTEFCTDGCQSNCDATPASSLWDGDVRDLVIGYYEAWVADRGGSCGFPPSQIPAKALTHLYISFGFISPNDFKIIPMPGMSPTIYDEVLNLKKLNPALKIYIALGGWTHNDEGTYRKVFSDLASTSANRKKFINNLIGFLSQYGFDGVDFDWEYPGADDRGGIEEDGVNYTALLAELQAAIKRQPTQYGVTFTAPTSYWYLRHFDIRRMMEYVNWMNLMSYDLHGVWDALRDKTKVVMGHTNMTEIDNSLNLLWRNRVPASQVVLGIGFYGRTFKLSDPACNKPGCPFKGDGVTTGGGDEGECTKTSGFLSYKEIMEKKKKVTVEHDVENAVKYFTYGKDNWVSFDDEETLQDKVKFANVKGLRGVMIWAVDQDDDEFTALKALLHPKSLQWVTNSTRSDKQQEDEESYFQDISSGACRATGCGGSCEKPREVEITSTLCFNKGKESQKKLCCPIKSAPNTDTCKWKRRSGDGNDADTIMCDGICSSGEVELMQSRYGDLKDKDACVFGFAVYCCDIPEKVDWTQKCGKADPKKNGGQCPSDRPKSLGTVKNHKNKRSYDWCCAEDVNINPDKCRWTAGTGDVKCKFGVAGCCADEHCTPEEVLITRDAWGGTIGKDDSCDVVDYNGPCFVPSGGAGCSRNARGEKSLCCQKADGINLFPPFKLEDLFPNPPTSDSQTKYDIKVDPTYGGAHKDNKQPTNSDEPRANDPFGFFIMAGEHLTTMKKRDLSHWDISGCAGSAHEGKQTVRAVCVDGSGNGKCQDIYKGPGAIGRIIELPDGCGAGTYAVIESLNPTEDQQIPQHLNKRDLVEPTVYDLTFDYNFKRVPRGTKDNQIRLDYSNINSYWDKVVDEKPDTKKRRKRSLDEFGGNHRRWLQDEWLQDHNDIANDSELRKRWFTTGIVKWVDKQKSLDHGLEANVDVLMHRVNENFHTVLYDEKVKCMLAGIPYEAKLKVTADLDVDISTSVGLTLIGLITFDDDGFHVSFSDSHVYFRNEGNVEAGLHIQADALAKFTTGEFQFFNAANFGATFKVHGIVTIGPNFKILGELKGKLHIKAEADVSMKLASWNIYQTYPALDSKNPANFVEGEKQQASVFDGPEKPSFDYNIEADGNLQAIIKPLITLGIDFDSDKIQSASIDLALQSTVTLWGKAGVGSETNAHFCYGLDTELDIFAQARAPNLFSASGQSFNSIYNLYNSGRRPWIKETCLSVGGDANSKRSIAWEESHSEGTSRAVANDTGHVRPRILLVDKFPVADSPSGLRKRDETLPANGEGLINAPSCINCRRGNGQSNVPGCGKCYQKLVEDSSFECEDATAMETDTGVDDICPASQHGMPGSAASKRAPAHKLFKRSARDAKICGEDVRSSPYDSCTKMDAKLPATAKYYDEASSLCTDVRLIALSAMDPNHGYATEHVFELQTVTRFFDEYIPKGTLNFLKRPRGSKAIKSCTWVKDKILDDNNQYSTVAGNKQGLLKAMYEACGSNANLGRLTLLESAVNGRKGSLFSGNSPASIVDFAKLQASDDMFLVAKETIQVYAYMGLVWSKYEAAAQDIWTALSDWETNYPNEIKLQAHWKAYLTGVLNQFMTQGNTALRAMESHMLKKFAQNATTMSQIKAMFSDPNAPGKADAILNALGNYNAVTKAWDWSSLF